MKKIINSSTGGAVLAGLALFSLPVFAQDSDSLDSSEAAPAAQPAAQASQVRLLPIGVGLGSSYQFKSDIDGGGDFSLTRVRAGVVVPVRLSDSVVLSTRVQYTLDSYDFGGGYNPWENINTFLIAPMFMWRADDHWSFYGAPLARLSAESGADFGQAFTGGGIAGFNYKFSDTLTLGGGLGVLSQLEDNALVVPLVTVNWKFADDWRLKVGFADVAVLGYTAAAVWDLNKQWELQFGAQYRRSRFRIEGSGPSADGVGQDTSGLLFAQATFHFSPTVDLTGFAGLVVGGNLRLENSSGNWIQDSNYDPAPTIGLRLNIRL